MAKTVLIARPHTFIVSDMKPFLEESGFETGKLENIDDLQRRVAGVSGAVISLALSSSVADSAEGVFLKLMKAAPKVPVLFASMLSFQQARSGLERIASSSGVQVNLVSLEATPVEASLLGRQETFLYLSKDDLSSTERRALASRLVQRHFR